MSLKILSVEQLDGLPRSGAVVRFSAGALWPFHCHVVPLGPEDFNLCYCGLCGEEKSSASTVQRTPLSKQRNKHLQTTLIEAAKMAPRNSPELAMLYDREGAQALDAPIDYSRDWQENTNSIFCSRPLAGLRQQMEVWFYLKKEPLLRSQNTRRRIRKDLHPRSSEASGEVLPS